MMVRKLLSPDQSGLGDSVAAVIHFTHLILRAFHDNFLVTKPYYTMFEITTHAAIAVSKHSQMRLLIASNSNIAC